MAAPEGMGKAERAQTAWTRRLTAVARFVVAVAIDSVPAVVTLVILLAGGVLAFYEPSLFRSAVGVPMPRGVALLVRVFTLMLPIVIVPKLVARWREKTARPWL